jgi:hypothetical protein
VVVSGGVVVDDRVGVDDGGVVDGVVVVVPPSTPCESWMRP